MKNNILSDKELTSLFNNDQIGCSPDPAIESRLDYAFLVKGRQHKVYQNSLLGSFSWLFSLKNIPAKAAFVSLVVGFSFFNLQQQSNHPVAPNADTTQFILPFELDSAHISPLNRDSCVVLKT